MHKLNTAINMLEKYQLAANNFDGYREGCVLSSFELQAIVSLLKDTRTELVLDMARAPG